ncbi:FliM/FliN family flagellar motor switch protein [Sulfobacillus thermosulfidooxidans]|uniref:FliM/FliN family flagellar motor switch protein n=1 Tax=Sulfobacillus thermosulfidooxidans TaxID=28034 RepID=UPI0006B60265|nr:FliM/FliN family flagellar motor switch protein [Sulfobacillus thermosulfidooxidans]
MSDEPLSQEEIDKLLQAVLSKENEKSPETEEKESVPEEHLATEPTVPETPVAPTPAQGTHDSFDTVKVPAQILEKWAPLGSLQLRFTAEIGTAPLKVGDIMQIGIGSRVPLKTRWMEPLVLKLNGKTVGYGRVVLVGNKFGVQVTKWGRLTH